MISASNIFPPPVSPDTFLNPPPATHSIGMNPATPEDPTWHWQRFRSFFDITIFRYFVLWFSLVPLIASLFRLRPDGFVFQGSGPAGAFRFAIPFEWRLSFSFEILWLSSLFFVLALILHAWACPKFIKDYPTFADYKAVLHSPRWMVREVYYVLRAGVPADRFFRELVDKRHLVPAGVGTGAAPGIEIQEKQTVVSTDWQGQRYLLALPLLVDGQSTTSEHETAAAELDIFWIVFAAHASSRSGVRRALRVLLLISGGLFAITFLQHIWSGLKSVAALFS